MYYTGVNDGFVLRDAVNTCYSYSKTSLNLATYLTVLFTHCLFTPPGTPSNNYFYPPVCGSLNGFLTPLNTGGSVAPFALAPELVTATSILLWSTRSSYTVKNPCMLSVSATSPSPLTI